MKAPEKCDSSAPTDEQLLVISQLFSTRFIHNLIAQKKPQQIKTLYYSLGCMQSKTHQNTSLGALYDEAYTLLKTRRKSEYVYKNELIHELITYHRATLQPYQQYSVIPEFIAGKSKVDIAVFNGSSTAYEIKTGMDNLDRLATQIADYRKVFQRVHIITDERHLNHIKKMMLPTIGLSIMDTNGILQLLQPAMDDFSDLDHAELFATLRTKELANMYSDLTGEELECPNMRIASICRPVFVALPIEEASAITLRILRLRKNRSRFEAFINTMPSSLTACASALSLSRVKEQTLAQTLKKSLNYIG